MLNRRAGAADNKEKVAAAEDEKPKELTPTEKGVGAAGAVAGSPLGKMAKLDLIAGAAAPAMPFFKQS